MPLSSVVKTFRFTDEPTGTTATVDIADRRLVTPASHTVTSDDVGRWANFRNVPGYSSYNDIIESVDAGAGTWTLANDLPVLALGTNIGPWTLVGTSPFALVGTGNGWLASDGSDFSGAAQPGCLQFSASGTPGFGLSVQTQFQSEFAVGLSFSNLTWEALGVPAGKFAVYTECRLRVKQATVTGLNTSTASFALSLVDEATWANTVGLSLTIASAAFDANWKTHTRGKFCVPEAYSPSSTLLAMFGSLNAGAATAGVPYVADYRFDTIEITTFYDDQWCDYCTQLILSPASVTLEVGQSQTFTTNLPADFSIVEGGDSGTLSNIQDQLVTYTAGNTPGTYHLLAADQCVAGNEDTSTITVVATGTNAFLQVLFKGYNDGDSIEVGDYGLPTDFVFVNPQANVAYIQSQTAVDPNNFIAGKMGFVELRRNGGHTLDTTDDPIGFVAIEVLYELGP